MLHPACVHTCLYTCLAHATHSPANAGESAPPSDLCTCTQVHTYVYTPVYAHVYTHTCLYTCLSTSLRTKLPMGTMARRHAHPDGCAAEHASEAVAVLRTPGMDWGVRHVRERNHGRQVARRGCRCAYAYARTHVHTHTHTHAPVRLVAPYHLGYLASTAIKQSSEPMVGR